MRSTEHARWCFLRACELDVAVRKPGNVSFVSSGHGMHAEQFIASAQAAARGLFAPGARVGERIESAVAATCDVAGCNTNLGILLLCAPIAAAVERFPHATTRHALRSAIQSVLADLDLDDARAAYRAIAHANPGGLGTSPSEDVRQPAGIDLRSAMALAAPRDSIARQYRDGYADLFEIAPAALGSGFSLTSPAVPGQLQAQITAMVQCLYLTSLSRWADSHIVRIHGEAMAHIVMTAAQAWLERAGKGCGLDADPAFATWDAALKAERVNPGTSADLTVAALMIAGLSAPS